MSREGLFEDVTFEQDGSPHLHLGTRVWLRRARAGGVIPVVRLRPKLGEDTVQER